MAIPHAHIDIAMAVGGAETATESADIAIMGSELDPLLFTRHSSRQTLRLLHRTSGSRL